MADAPPPMELMADQDDERLDVFLARRSPGMSRSQARRLVEDGLVLVDGSLERISYRLRFGEMVRIQPAAAPATVAEAVAIDLDIRYEDDDVLIVNKPVGLTVHPAPGEPEATLVSALLARYPSLADWGDPLRPGLVHRLDRDTSGLMVVAKTPEALEDLQQQIRARSVEKRYLAVVQGTPDPLEGVIDAPIARDPGNPRRMAVLERGRPSRTEYTVTERFLEAALLECTLITGRTHQIRVHLAALGHPILGDEIYGHRSEWIDRQSLHSRVLGFRHPRSGEAVRVVAEPPADFQALLGALRGGGMPHGSAGAAAGTVGRRRDDRRAWKRTRHRTQRIR